MDVILGSLIYVSLCVLIVSSFNLERMSEIFETNAYDDLVMLLRDHGLDPDVEEADVRLEMYQPFIDQLAARQKKRFMDIGRYWAPASMGVEDNLDIDEIEREYYFSKLRGKVLVDVGAGKESHIRSLALRFGVRLLIEIEKHYPNDETGWYNVFEDELSIVRARGDILEVLSLLPDGSVNVVMNHIERCITPIDAYRHAMLEEVGRVVLPLGIWFGNKSDLRHFVPPGFTRKTFFENNNRGFDGQFFSFEKGDSNS